MPWVRWRRRETKVAVESDGLFVLGMNGERANADQVRNLKRAPERIEQKSSPKAVALCVGMNGNARKH